MYMYMYIKCACTSLLHCVCVCTYSYLAQEYLGKYGEERDFNKLPVSYPPVSETIYCSVHGVFTCTMMICISCCHRLLAKRIHMTVVCIY